MNDRCAENFVLPRLRVNLNKAFRRFFENRPVDTAELLRVSIDLDTSLLCILRIQSDMGQFGRGVGRPWNGQRTRFGPSLEQGILDHDPRHEISRVCELVG